MAEIIQYANGVPGIIWRLDKKFIRIGRCSKSNDVHLDDGFASKVHAQIEIQQCADKANAIDYLIRDMGSTNKTYVNQTTVSYQQLNHNDVLTIGKSKFVFVCEDVEEYITPEMLCDDTLADIEHQSAEAVAMGESKENNSCPVELDTSYPASGHKFSRRLNFL